MIFYDDGTVIVNSKFLITILKAKRRPRAQTYSQALLLLLMMMLFLRKTLTLRPIIEDRQGPVAYPWRTATNFHTDFKAIIQIPSF